VKFSRSPQGERLVHCATCDVAEALDSIGYLQHVPICVTCANELSPNDAMEVLPGLTWDEYTFIVIGQRGQ
jgi:hypothetical protein